MKLKFVHKGKVVTLGTLVEIDKRLVQLCLKRFEVMWIEL